LARCGALDRLAARISPLLSKWKRTPFRPISMLMKRMLISSGTPIGKHNDNPSPASPGPRALMRAEDGGTSRNMRTRSRICAAAPLVAPRRQDQTPVRAAQGGGAMMTAMSGQVHRACGPRQICDRPGPRASAGQQAARVCAPQEHNAAGDPHIQKASRLHVSRRLGPLAGSRAARFFTPIL